MTKSNIHALADTINAGLIGRYNSKLADLTDAINALNDSHESQKQRINKVEERLSDIEHRQQEEAQTAEAATQNREARIAKYIGYAIVYPLKYLYKFLVFILRFLKCCSIIIWNVIANGFYPL